MSFPAYPAYRDSGVDWLGEVPSDWEVRKLRTGLADSPCYGVLVPDFDDDGIPMLRITDMEAGIADRTALTTISRSLSAQYARTIVEEGDVLLSVVGTIGETLKVDHQIAGVNLSRAIARLCPNDELHADFLCWVFNSDSFHHFIDLICVGTAQRVLNMSALSAYRAAFPTLVEQSAIAAFLGHETAKIDALVAEQERLIALLKEKRQAVISHAVTKGLDPNAPMKDSGVEWLGQVPAHWTVVRIKHVTDTLDQGWSPQCEAHPVESDDAWGVLKVGCVNGGSFNPEENKTLPADLEPVPDLALRAGDVLISRANTRDLVGSAAMVAVDYPRLMLCDKLYRVRLDRHVAEPKFLASYLVSRAARERIELAAGGASASMLNISQDAILNMAMALPPLEEQTTIIREIARRCGDLDTLTMEATHAIALLRERRAALISAAVTGKIDVRGFVRPDQQAA